MKQGKTKHNMTRKKFQSRCLSEFIRFSSPKEKLIHDWDLKHFFRPKNTNSSRLESSIDLEIWYFSHACLFSGPKILRYPRIYQNVMNSEHCSCLPVCKAKAEDRNMRAQNKYCQIIKTSNMTSGKASAPQHCQQPT